MAEAVGLAASIIAVIQLADRIGTICKFYIQSINDCPRDLRLILIEISTVKAIFENLEFVDKLDPMSSIFLKAQAGPDGPIAGCLQAMKELESLLPSEYLKPGKHLYTGSSKRHKVNVALAILAWPFKKDKARTLLDELTQHKSTICMAFSAEANQDLKDIKRELGIVHDTLTDAQKHDVCNWLQRTDPSPNHNQALKLYEEGTGSWVLRTSEWSNWIGLRKRCLWIHGIPGAGKTILASYLIEEIKKVCSKWPSQRGTWVYFYCYHARNQDEAAPFLCWIISQLCRKAGKIPSKIYDIYKNSNEPTLSELLDSLEAVLDFFETVFITIDAVDESQQREGLLKILNALVSDLRFRKIQLLATSREYLDIKQVMVGISQPLSMANKLVEADIRYYVSKRIQSTPRFQQWPEILRQEVEDKLSKGSQGMFRWAVCQLDILRRQGEVKAIRAALQDLPITLDETYNRIFSYVAEEDWPFLRHALRMICGHGWLYDVDDNLPISSGLIVSSYASMLQHEPVIALDHFYTPESLKEICGCLVTFSYNAGLGQETAALAHYTVREFLESDRVTSGPATYFFLPRDGVGTDFLISIFQHNLSIEQYEQVSVPKEWKKKGQEKVILYLTLANSNVYTLFSAIKALYYQPDRIADNEKLTALAYDFLNPGSSHFYERMKFTKATISQIDDLSDDPDFFLFSSSFGERRFWDLNWMSIPYDPRVAILTELLWIGNARKLALKLAATISPQSLRQTQLSLNATGWFSIIQEDITVELSGNIIEIVSQASCLLDAGAEYMKLLCSIAGWFDPTAILISYIGSHKHDSDCTPDCMIGLLLELGANPNAPGYRVKPLQIAVACEDYHAVDLLLAAGAVCNNVGDASGLKWGDNMILGRFFNILYGYSPLHIIRHVKDFLDWDYRDERFRGRERLGIENLLLEHGARVIPFHPGS